MRRLLPFAAITPYLTGMDSTMTERIRDVIESGKLKIEDSPNTVTYKQPEEYMNTASILPFLLSPNLGPWLNLDMRPRTAMHQVNFGKNQRKVRRDNRRKNAAGFRVF